MVQQPRSMGANTRRAGHSCPPSAKLPWSPDSLCDSPRSGAAVTGSNSKQMRSGNSNARFLTVAGPVSALEPVGGVAEVGAAKTGSGHALCIHGERGRR